MAWNDHFVGKGRGLNSIPVRFALMAGVTTSATLWLASHWLSGAKGGLAIAALLLLLALPMAINYLAANKLAGMIRSLRQSTQALVAGDFDRPVEVDCACEVGGLADSFRAMVSRLNSNILRMNVLAYTDAVTGLPNRAVISHVLSLAQQMPPETCAGAIVFIDLDGFKRVNDTLGHDAGDDLLRQVADRVVTQGLQMSLADLDSCTTAFGELCQSCPTRPVFARFAGDEFLLLLPGHFSREDLTVIATRIQEAFAQSFTVFKNQVFVTASMGLARMPEDAATPAALLTYADIAMYRAKEAGKNGFMFFDASLREKVEERALIERELHRAVEQETLDLHYQPKFDARTMQVSGVEALARWSCPGLGPVSPDIFIGIAEQCGLMVPMGEAILRIALRQTRAWQEAGLAIKVAVNVSPVQFERPGFVETVLESIQTYGVAPELLELEITETIAMADFSRTRERVDALREAGIAISIDDFGIGYSNLSQLARLDYDALKVDRSLVASIGADPKTEAMLTAILTVSKALGHKVIAEGIERPEQLNHLMARGCDEFQGYLLAQPMPAHVLEGWLAERRACPVQTILPPARQKPLKRRA
ncbi:bifunctional diguanylate cyclase/phosphodiesterase [Novosphingobium umbonatum]|nr:EAL domain-containing protein [Novosphingobium umbonatum]